MTFFSVLKFVGILLEVLLIFNLLIIVHELGHFLAAKWRGLYIERFGIWFGKPIWEKKIGGIWYSLGSIPAGGFVKLPQLAPMEALEGQTEIPKDQLKPIARWIRSSSPLPGRCSRSCWPSSSLSWSGKSGGPWLNPRAQKVIGQFEEGSPAEKVGLKAGDEIVAIDDIPVAKFAGQGHDSILWRIVRSEGKSIKIQVKRGEELKTFEPEPKIPTRPFYERKGTRKIGIGPALTPLVGDVKDSGAAKEAGLQKGDFITHVNDQPLYRPFGLSTTSPITRLNRSPSLSSVATGAQGPVQATLTQLSPMSPRMVPPIARGSRKGDRLVRMDEVGSRFQQCGDQSHPESRQATAHASSSSAGGKALPPINVTPADNADFKPPHDWCVSSRMTSAYIRTSTARGAPFFKPLGSKSKSASEPSLAPLTPWHRGRAISSFSTWGDP
jgi:membrane-associated protease RseP (regulator of RpoE activity)